MTSRDELLWVAEQLALALPSGSRNDVKKVLRYFQRHGSLGDLLTRSIPFYGRDQTGRWNRIRKTFQHQQRVWGEAGYSQDEIAFIIGWAARLAGARTA